MRYTRVCELQECDVEFETDNPRKIHCSAKHSTLNRKRRSLDKKRRGGGGPNGGGGGGGEATLFDTITPIDSRATYVPTTCYRTPPKRRPAAVPTQPLTKSRRPARANAA